jgi:hypothetical protein
MKFTWGGEYSQESLQRTHRLDLVLALDQEIQQLLRVNSGLPEVSHQANQGCIPPAHVKLLRIELASQFNTWL